jgi:hypothetical protein
LRFSSVVAVVVLRVVSTGVFAAVLVDAAFCDAFLAGLLSRRDLFLLAMMEINN